MLRFLTNRQGRRRSAPRAGPSAPLGEEPTRRSAPDVTLAGRGAATDYAHGLLRDLGVSVGLREGGDDPHPAIDWARSGAMALTGRTDGPPLLAPGPLASAARGALRAARALADGPIGRDDSMASFGGPERLGERAAAAGLRRRGRVSPGGACRLLATRDGFIALHLARPDDVALLPAWLEGPASLSRARDPWSDTAPLVASRPTTELVERARWMGLPAAPVWPAEAAPSWLALAATGPARRTAVPERLRVVDLSHLWAGPLCAAILAAAGAHVVKVESTERPDGARFGPTAFFDALNHAKQSAVLSLGSRRGREALSALIESADVVVESARPRALAQLGVSAEEWVARRPGGTWVSITGYGRAAPRGDWVAFGDDAGAAAGLAVATGSDDERPLFCGDAVADPLTGLHAAVAALASQRQGGGHLLDLSLAGVAARALHFPIETETACVVRGPGGWRVEAGGRWADVAPPALPSAPRSAPPLGADTESVLREIGAT